MRQRRPTLEEGKKNIWKGSGTIWSFVTQKYNNNIGGYRGRQKHAPLSGTISFIFITVSEKNWSKNGLVPPPWGFVSPVGKNRESTTE